MILTLAVCYHARIQERENFELEICKKFEAPVSTEPISKEKFVKEISRYIIISSYICVLCKHKHIIAFMIQIKQIMF